MVWTLGKHTTTAIEPLTDEQLDSMRHEQLYHHFKQVRAFASTIINHWGRRCCEICKEYIGSNWEEDVGEPYKVAKAYRDQVKAALLRRPYKAFSKEAKKAERLAKVVNKPDRQRPKTMRR